MTTRSLPRVAVPMGAPAWAPNLSIRENAERAWEAARTNLQRQCEVGSKLALRRAFALMDAEFFYLDRYPRIPLCELGDDLIAYNGSSLFLASRCRVCAEELRNEGDFASLAQYGEKLDVLEKRDAFICSDCREKETTRLFGKRK